MVICNWKKKAARFGMFLTLGLAAGVLAALLPALGCKQLVPAYQKRVKILIATAPYTVPMMEARFIFLVDHLSRETGARFEMIAGPPKLEAFIETVKAEEVAFSFQNPYMYMVLARERGAVPLAKTISLDGRTEFRGLIVLREGSPIQSLNELRGKTILATSRYNVGGFVAQWSYLKEQGLDPDRELNFAFKDAQETILEKLDSGQAEVGFIREDVLTSLEKARGRKPRVRILAASPYFPNHNFVAYPAAEPELVEKVKEILLNLTPDDPEQKFILDRLRISGFAPTSAADYADFTSLMISNGFVTPPAAPEEAPAPTTAPVTP